MTQKAMVEFLMDVIGGAGCVTSNNWLDFGVEIKKKKL